MTPKEFGQMSLVLFIVSILLLCIGNEWGYVIGVPAFFGLAGFFIET